MKVKDKIKKRNILDKIYLEKQRQRREWIERRREMTKIFMEWRLETIRKMFQD